MSKLIIGKNQKFTTGMISEVSHLVWEINDVRSTIAIMDKKLEGVKLDFEAGNKIGVPSRWRFFFNVREDGTIGIFLKLLKSSDEMKKPIFAEFTIDPRLEEHCGGIRNYNETGTSWGFESVFKSMEDLLSPDLNNLEKAGSVLIRLKFTLYNNALTTLITEIAPKTTDLDTTSGSAVLQDLGKVLESGVGADVKIQTADGKELKAHKLILAARSPVFSTMFQTEMIESASGVVSIPDLSYEAMRIVLKFMYTGKMGDDWEEVIEEVIHAAEKYTLPLMKEYCDRMLGKTCTPKNAWSHKKLAKLHGLSQAETEIAEFIKENIGEILKAEDSA